MKNSLLYILLGLLIVYIIVTTISKSNDTKDWNESYNIFSSTPYAAEILKNLLEKNSDIDSFILNNSSIIDMDFDSFISSDHTFVFVNRRLAFEQEVADMIKEFVHSGNNVFLSAYMFDQTLITDLNLKINLNYEVITDTLYDSFIKNGISKDRYKLKSKPGTSTYPYFESISNDLEILGYNAIKEPNFIRKKYGNNFLYLHLNPKAFTNLNLIDSESINYANQVFDKIGLKNVILDNYYKGSYAFSDDSKSAYSYIWDNPRLNLAFWSLLVLIFLFLILNTRRNQNILKLHQKPLNKSKEFVYTIAQLFYSRRDHKSIAKTEINYFMTHLREKYHYSKLSLNIELAKEISFQSGCDKKVIIDLFNSIIRINKMKTVEADELVTLTNLINEYHTTRN